MKLKPQSSAKELLETSLEQLRSERSALSLEVTDLLKSRNALKRDIQAEGETLFASLRKTEQECLGQKETLKQEIASLEERKRVLLLPLDERKKQLDDRELAIKSREDKVSSEETQLKGWQSVLAETTEALANRTAELVDREKEIERKEQKIESSLAFHVKSSQALADKWQVFREYEAKRTAEMDERSKDLDFKEMEVEKEKIYYENTKKELQDLRTDLDSRRLLLSQAQKERYGRNPE